MKPNLSVAAVVFVFSLSLPITLSAAEASEGHIHPASSGTGESKAIDDNSNAKPGSGADAYGEFAAHLEFASNGVYADAYWKALPAIDEEGFLQIEFRDAKTHALLDVNDSISVAVWNSAYGYGLFQPTLEPALKQHGQTIPGTYNVSGIYFLATGQWEVRVYLKATDGTEVNEAFVVDLGEVAPSPAMDPNSAVSAMHSGMTMPGMNHSKKGRPSLPSPQAPAAHSANHSGHVE